QLFRAAARHNLCCRVAEAGGSCRPALSDRTRTPNGSYVGGLCKALDRQAIEIHARVLVADDVRKSLRRPDELGLQKRRDTQTCRAKVRRIRSTRTGIAIEPIDHAARRSACKWIREQCIEAAFGPLHGRPQLSPIQRAQERASGM